MNAVQLVREPDASDERVKEAYRDIKESLRISFVDAMFQAYAVEPRFLDYIWRRLRPSMLAPPFLEQARKVGETAESGIQTWSISDHATVLHGRNYGESDLRKLREIVELFYIVYPKLAIIANAVRIALGGEPVGGGGVPHPADHADKDRLVRDFRGLQIPMADEREAPLRVRTAFEDIQRQTAVPFLGSEHRAMGAYPDWLEVFWIDARPMLADVRRRELIGRIDRAAQEAARQLPYPLYMNAGVYEHMTKVNDLFCALLPGLVLDAAIARKGLGPEPTP